MKEAIEQGYNAPFEIKRVYYIFDTKEGVERGFHAHINLKQICIAVLDGEEIKLDNPNQGLIWREHYDYIIN